MGNVFVLTEKQKAHLRDLMMVVKIERNKLQKRFDKISLVGYESRHPNEMSAGMKKLSDQIYARDLFIGAYEDALAGREVLGKKLKIQARKRNDLQVDLKRCDDEIATLNVIQQAVAHSVLSRS